jgi:hypothetical protein
MSKKVATRKLRERKPEMPQELPPVKPAIPQRRRSVRPRVVNAKLMP